MKICIICTSVTNAGSFYESNKDDPNILFEFRLDYDPSLIDLLKIVPLERVILTLRSIEEGGNPSQIRIEEFLDYPVKYLDLELVRDKTLIRDLISKNIIGRAKNYIISSHNFIQPYKSAFETYEEKLQALGYSLPHNFITKFVGEPIDTVEILDQISERIHVWPRHSFLGKSHHADIVRTCGKKFNQEFVFGSAGDLNIISYSALKNLFLTDKNVFLGLIGRGIQRSLSPAIHQILLQQESITGYYHLLEVSNSGSLGKIKSYLIALEFRGFNITSPYKFDMIQHVDRLEKSALLTNSVNTVKIENDTFIGFNTDTSGFKHAFSNSLELVNSVLVIGASGAARSAAQSSLDLGLEVTLVMRSQHRFTEFSSSLIDEVSIVNKFPNEFDGAIVNASPLGRSQNDSVEIPNKTKLMIDLNYSLDKSGAWERKCDKLKIKFMDGKAMVFHQAVDAFQIWTNTEIDRSAAYTKFIGGLQ